MTGNPVDRPVAIIFVFSVTRRLAPRSILTSDVGKR